MAMRYLAAILLALATPLAATAQPVVTGDGCTLYDHGGSAVAGAYVAPPALGSARRDAETVRVVSQGTARFEVDYTGFTPQARAAFQKAVDIWSNHLTSSVPIRVQAEFASLGTNVLGSAGPNLTANFPNAPQANVFYPFALADALAGQDLNPAQGAFFYDIVSTFNSTYGSFYFGTDGNTPNNQIDFVSVVLHELGHGLGFIGSGALDDGRGQAECTGTVGNGCWGYFDSGGSTQFFAPVAFDTFIEDASGRRFTDRSVYPNPGSALGDLLQSQDLFLNSPNVVRIYGRRGPIWAPAPFELGSSFSHWDEVVIRNSSAALMTPSLSRGESYQDPGDITCALFLDLGWTLGDGCQLLTVDGEEGAAVARASLVAAGPNPTASATAFRLRVGAPVQARVQLVDALGRRVATLFEGVARDGTRVAVDAQALPSGVYHVVAHLGDQRTVGSFTVAR